MPHFYYCSSVWHFCGGRNTDKVDNLNKRILRLILQDYSSSYDILLSKVNLKSLFIRRLQTFIITLITWCSLYGLHPTICAVIISSGPSQHKSNLLSLSELSPRHLQNITFSTIQAGDSEIWSFFTIDPVIFPSACIILHLVWK